MNANKTSSWNTAVGAWSLQLDTTGVSNTATGFQSLYWNASGSENSGFGRDAIMNNITGYQNTGIGNRTMENNTSGHSNTALGFLSLQFCLDGSYNTAIGDSANIATSSLNNTTALGAKTIVSTSNSMAFGDVNVNRWVFARNSVSSGVFQVGYNATNGNGAYLTAGGVWTDISDRILKDGIETMNRRSVLDKIMNMPVTKWKYKGTPGEFHIGPMAQDFEQLFGIGDGRSVSAMDKSGVALLGIQALQDENEDMKKMIDLLTKRVAELEQRSKQ